MEKAYAKVLKTLREQRNLTQTELAKTLGISQRAYAHYEKGENEPSIETLIRLAEYYGVPVDVIIGRYQIP